MLYYSLIVCCKYKLRVEPLLLHVSGGGDSGEDLGQWRDYVSAGLETPWYSLKEVSGVREV